MHRLVRSIVLATFAALAGVPGTATAQPSSSVGKRETNVKAALADSFKLAMLEHGIRVAFQPKTRRELGGPFWSDYRRSVRAPTSWEDTDSWLVNYIGHPIHGAAAGLLWADHAADAGVEFGLDSRYWSSRGRAAAFSAAYSFQFEIGPLSEASIGNVGLRPQTTGWVDYVVTPAGAFGLMVAEDALDKYLIEWIERHTANRVARAVVRMVFNPSRLLANLAQGRTPWYRHGRPISEQIRAGTLSRTEELPQK